MTQMARSRDRGPSFQERVLNGKRKEGAEKKDRRGDHGKRHERSRSRKRRKEKKREKEKDTPHFRWERGMRLGPDGRYVVERLLGDGTFGRVLRCRDAKTESAVAVKVVKGVKRYCQQAESEAEILSEILRQDPGRQSLCVELLGTFAHQRQHFCIVFEPLDTSVRDFLKANDSRGLYLADVRQMAKQLLQSLAFLHGIRLIHTDLKCRNIMLRDGTFDLAPHPRAEGAQTRRPRSCGIAVIDFGGAIFPDEWHGGLIGTRQFRAPEVVLGLQWDETSDIWSAGCIVAMLYLGQRPFSVHENLEHLAMMERLLGRPVPPWMARQADNGEALPEGVAFRDDGSLDWPRAAGDEDAVGRVEELRPLSEQLRPQHGEFLALLHGLLEIDPGKRLSAAAALETAFFREEDVQE
mmetsp:Transcript_99035/g.288851  ORF Transcript_99035/g.288851 Transcript_99035/m.288851 type:complete len:409 (+) Transcript_99035:41-1267(+)